MKFLVIGGGSIGQRHIKNLQALGFKDIFCLKRKLDKKFSLEKQVKVITDLSDLKKEPPDAVFVCTPTALHIQGLHYAVSVNASIFMEKPLIHHKEGLGEATKLLLGYNKVFFIGFMLRYHPLVMEIKKLLDQNYIGAVYNARFEFGSYLPFWHPYEDYKESYASKKELGGGVINTITHELDLIQHLFGTPESVNCISQNLNRLEIEVEEQCEAVFKYADKLVSLHLDYLQKDYDRRIRILGEKGAIIWNWHDNLLSIKIHKQKVEHIKLQDEFDVNQLYVDELKHFIKLMDTNQISHDLTGLHAITNTKLTLAMHQAADENTNIGIK